MSEADTKPTDEITSRARMALKMAIKETPEIVFAMVATVDGFEVASQMASGWDIASSRVAAMASSGHALGETVANELTNAACQSVIIDADRLSIVFLSIPHLEEPPLIMGVAATKSASLGSVLYSANRCAARIGDNAVEAS